MNEAFMEMEDASQPLFPQQKVQWLIRGIKNDNIQVQTTIGIIHDRYLDDFDGTYLTLYRTISSRFASIEPGKNKRSIGAVKSNSGRDLGRGRGRGRHGGCGGNTLGGRMRVQMNGVDVTDVTRVGTTGKIVLRWLPRHIVSHHLRCEDGSYQESPLCRGRSCDGNSSQHNILHCCEESRQCTHCLPHCDIERSRCNCMRRRKCVPECSVSREDLVCRRARVWFSAWHCYQDCQSFLWSEIKWCIVA